VRLWLGLLAAVALVLGAACGPGGGSSGSVVTPRLAYIGPDGQGYTVPPDGGEPRRIGLVPGETPVPVGQRFTRWPTWSPDGQRLAFMRFEISRVVDDKAAIFVAGLDGSLTKAFETTDEPPIYMAWAPDGSVLTLLTQRQQELRLQLVDPSGSSPPREVAVGGPIYFGWSPDASGLLLHVNGDRRSTDQASMALLHPAEGSEAQPLSASPTDFRAPAWSSDGTRMAFVAQAPGGQAALSVLGSRDSETSRLAVVGSEPAFLWSPATDRLAYSSKVAGQPLLYRGIETIKADGSDRQQVTPDEAVAFYWSPDGKRLAYVGIDPNARALAWFVVEPDGKNRRQVASFVPSDEQLFMFAFFDQYAQSHAVWSPDGKYLVYAGSPPGSAQSKPAADPTSGLGQGTETERSQIFVAAADGSSAPRALVDGSIGLWPVTVPGKK